MKVNYYNINEIDEENLKYVVIVSKYEEKWIFVKHKKRDTWEIPGGHIEKGEKYIVSAKRELFEETGAVDFNLKPICVYSVKRNDDESFGMLLYSEIKKLDELPNFEIEKIELFEKLPEKLTYPSIQNKLFERILNDKRVNKK